MVPPRAIPNLDQTKRTQPARQQVARGAWRMSNASFSSPAYSSRYSHPNTGGLHARFRRRCAPAHAWIAATALLLDVPLVTHNGAHYRGVEGLRVLSEV